MTDIETLKLAREVLDTCDGGTSGGDPYQRFDKKLVDKAITAIDQAIEQAEQATVKQSLTVEQAQPVAEPYGQVTVVRRPGCVDQHWFYRWPEPPYLDNAAECHTVYTAPPPPSKPLTIDELWQNDELMALNAQLGCGMDLLIEVVEAIEAAHGIKEKNT